MFEDFFYELARINKKVLQDWIELNAKMGAWTIYGTPHKYEMVAKQHAGRLFVFKRGVKVTKLKDNWVVMFWEPI